MGSPRRCVVIWRIPPRLPPRRRAAWSGRACIPGMRAPRHCSRSTTICFSAMIRIGIDARELLGDATGVGRYLGELLRRWVDRPDAASRQFVLYTPESLPFMATVPEAANVREMVVGSGRGTWWEQTHLRRAVRGEPPDVFFA